MHTLTKAKRHLGLLIVVACLANSLLGDDKNKSDEFVDNYDLNGDYAARVYRVDGMRVWNQFENGLAVRDWAPTESGKMGTLVLRYAFDKPIESCSVRAWLKIWREGDEVSLSVSHDDQEYHVLTTGSLIPEPKPPYSQKVLDLSPYVRGKRAVYIRIQLKGTKLNTHITTPEFLRTSDEQTIFKSPHVFEFRATLNEDIDPKR